MYKTLHLQPIYSAFKLSHFAVKSQIITSHTTQSGGSEIEEDLWSRTQTITMTKPCPATETSAIHRRKGEKGRRKTY